MQKVAIIKFVSWDEERYFLFDEAKDNLSFKTGLKYLFNISIADDVGEVMDIVDDIPSVS